MNSWQSQAGCIVRNGAMMLDELSGLDGLGWLPEGSADSDKHPHPSQWPLGGGFLGVRR